MELQEKVSQQQPEQEAPDFSLTKRPKSDWHPVWVFVEGGRIKDKAFWNLTLSSPGVRFGGNALQEARRQGDHAAQGAGDTVVASMTTMGGADGFWVWAHDAKAVTITGTVKFQGSGKVMPVKQTYKVKMGLKGPVRVVAQRGKEAGLMLSFVQGFGKGPKDGGGTTTGGTTTGGTTTGGTTTGGTTGSVDGGSADGGSADGGSADGGSADGGGADGVTGGGDGGGADGVTGGGDGGGADGGCVDGGCGGG